MKKIFTIVSIFFLFTPILLSQNFWDEVALPNPDAVVSLLSVNDDGTLFLGTGDYHFYYSNDNGDTWTESSNWPDLYVAECMAFNSSGDLFVGTFSNGMLRSVDGGNTFTEINNGLSFYNIWDIDINNEDDIILATSGGIFRSANNGDAWEVFGTGLPDFIETVNYSSNNRIYAGTFDAGMWRSEDNGITWASINNGLSDTAMVTAFEVVPDVELYAGIFPTGLFRSTDYGDTWLPYNNGLPFTSQQIRERGLSVTSINLVYGFIYIAVYNYGVYFLMRSIDADKLANDNYLWILQDAGLVSGPTTSTMAGGGPDNNLFLGTYDQGMFRNAHPVSVENTNEPHNFYIFEEMSPNPVTNSTNFTFSVPEKSNVLIDVYDIAGQKIETIINKEYAKGTYNVKWTPKFLQGGLYFCKMRAGDFNDTKKLIYLK